MKKQVLLIVFLSFFLNKGYSQCTAPTSTSAISITSTKATITWVASGTNNGFEILLIPSLTIPAIPSENPEISNGMFLFTAGSVSTFAIPNGTLQPATRYYYYVRKICTNSKSTWKGGTAFTTTICENVDKCNYTFFLTNTDSESTWNGATVQVIQNGQAVVTLGPSGINSTNGVNVAICKNIPFEIYWLNAGFYPEKIGFTVYDSYMEEVYKKPAGLGTPETTLFSGIASCLPPACQRPTSLLANSITTNSAQINWSDSNSPTAQLYDLYVTSFGSTAPENGITSGPGLISNVTSPYTLTSLNGQPLTPSTKYLVYARSKCSVSSNSTWSYAPMGFTTLLANDECSNAYPVAVNVGQVCSAAMTHGTTNGATQSLPIPSTSIGGCGSTEDDVWFSFVATNTSHTISFKNIVASPVSVKINHTLLSGDCSSLAQLYCSIDNVSIAGNLTIGQTYYIRVYTSSISASQYVEFDVCITSPPVNNECSTALTVPVNPTRDIVDKVSGSTLGANASLPTAGSSAGCGTTEDDIWFTFIAESGTHIINLTNIGDAYADLNHSVYSGTNCDLTLRYCSNANQSVASGLTVGEQYTIRVYTALTSVIVYASFDVSITTAPSFTNDECVNALPLTVNAQNTANSISTIGTLTGATASPQPGTCNNGDDDVWYHFTATSTNIVLELENLYPTGILYYALYSGNDCNNLSQLACNQNGFYAHTLTVGQTYFIKIWSVSTVALDTDFEIKITNVATPIVVNSLLSPTQLVTNVLMDNPCITVSNVTSSTGTNFGSVNGVGYFSAPSGSNFPISSGIVLSSGDLNNVPGPNLTVSNTGAGNWSGDTDLNAIIFNATGNQMNSKNASKLEFDFTTVNESMSFNFLFASEEYGQFQCDFSDTFAFLLTNLNTNVTTNLAVVPNTSSPISTVTIRDNANNDECASVNPEFFDAYYESEGMDAYKSATNFNGITKLMTASSPVIPNVPYHIKLVVADRLDTQYDSAVFIQGGSFTSGPPECSDKIKLIAFVDTNGNGTKEESESSFTYGSFVYQLNDAPEVNHISSPIGNYTVYDSNPANSYDFSYAIDSEYQPYFAASATNFSNITIPVGSGTNILYFPITVTQGYNDVTVSIVPVSPPVAGMSFKNKIVYTNHGIAPANGTITFMKDPVSSITSISTSGTVNIPNGFTYDFTNLAPFESRSILVTMSIPPIPTVNIDDVLSSNVTISAPANDINVTNNAVVNTQIVVASYDPNDKMEAHGEKIQFSTFNQNDYLTYTIRFQNTGTSNAINIRLEDMLDSQFDETSIRMIDASHHYIMNRVGNKVTWYFDYIQLPGMFVNEAASHGYVTFTIKLKPGFAIGDIIPNHADIYFDTNPPITTNTFNVEFVTQLSATEFDKTTVMVYPNPTNSILNINSTKAGCVIEKVIVYDLVGKVVKSIHVNSVESTLNVADLSNGIYLIEITDDTNRKFIHKMVKN